jgi:hypothetical protein
MGDDTATRLELYKLYLATAEKVSDRRSQANTWMLSVNGAVVGLYGYLGKSNEAVTDAEKALWLWAIPIAGILICLGWAGLLEAYSKLNEAKFKVIQELEPKLGELLFKREQEIYKASGRRRLSAVEAAVPWSFIGLYVLILTAAVAFGAR